MSVNVTSSKSSQDHCKSCNQSLRAGEIICPACGLPTTSTGKTHKIAGTHGLQGEKSWSLDPRSVAEASIIFEIGDQAVMLPTMDSFIVGRAGNNYTPDLDLNAFGGEDKGVSRQHVQINREMLIYISDMGSTNGTFLNGQRLFVNTEYVLSDGDELHIGYLKVRVCFQWS